MNVPAFADVEDAAARLAGRAVVTPVLENATLNERVGRRVLLKAECLQVSGSFKFRGAYNRISRLSEDERRRGVVAYSSGNHAQGVAAAAKLVGAPALIVMPSDAPAVKVEGVRAFGGEVRLYDRWTESREAIGAEIAAQRGSVLVPPFDDVFVIAGQGTTGLEFARQAQAAGAGLEAVLVPASGGGLVAGVNLAMQALSPATRVFCVEPHEFNDYQLSLAAGERVTHGPGQPSMCDALMSPMPGEITFAVNRDTLAGGLTATEAEVSEAVRFAFRHLKLVVEPGGAAGLAALLAGRVPAGAGAVGVVLSGGNVDPALYARLIQG
ncbi:threonine/serine dehydratase [Caulobacter sp. 17J80-11]|uniref:threonine ammonia-lyase n=1 Tax=Caulobacter sp. 17J80-11 TaxID=2763502 RepID=UPI001653C13E|nr:threonine/serine dehydratase [Caulobacter sp. 17J80-11]MBC6983601.1 threonine/serine dehydratase [Caulobacter sp. 17J80-11]